MPFSQLLTRKHSGQAALQAVNTCWPLRGSIAELDQRTWQCTQQPQPTRCLPSFHAQLAIERLHDTLSQRYRLCPYPSKVSCPL